MKTVEFIPNENSNAKLFGYLHESNEEQPNRLSRPCVMVCPGGGYEMLSERESDAPAFAFYAKGYHVFVLYYSIKEEAAGMTPLIEISKSVMLIRRHAEEWGIIPDQIAVCGFSAGGHLAGSLGTLWNHPKLLEKLDTQNGLNRPNAQILCYPVISGGIYAHRGSFEQLTGGEYDEESIAFYSLENHVSGSTPPTFLWHAVDDDIVPVENALMYAAALQRNKVPFECHLYPNGGHGLSMSNVEVNRSNGHCATWFPLCAQWLGELFQFEY